MTHQNHFETVGTTDHLIEYNIKITAQNFKEGTINTANRRAGTDWRDKREGRE